MANMLAMGLDPVQQAIRQRLNTGAVIPTEPVVPTEPTAATGTSGFAPSPDFAPPVPTMPTAQAGAAPDLASAIRTKIAPTMGATRTFPNGRIGQWDGQGWLHVG